MTVELGLLTSFPGNKCTNHLCLGPPHPWGLDTLETMRFEEGP